jgi:hypothetical protein
VITVRSPQGQRAEAPAADRLGRQDAEQVEVGSLFVLEVTHVKPGVLGAAEYLETAIGFDHAHGARHLLVDRVSGLRDAGQREKLREHRLR